MHFTPLVLLTLLTLPNAEASAQGETAGSAESASPSPPPSQAVLSPTALTAPAGSLSFTSHEVVGFGVTYVPIDRLQLKVLGVIGPPIGAHNVVPFRHLEAKLRLVDWGPLHLAVVGFSNRIYSQYVAFRTEGAGIVGTLCTGPECRWAFSLAAGAGYHRTVGSSDDGGGVRSTLLFYSASAVRTFSPRWSLLLEAVGTGEVGCNLHCDDEPLEGLVLSAGPRFSWRALTVDLALVLLVEPGSFAATPLPWLAVSYRAL